MSASPRDELGSAFAGRRVLVTGHTGFKGSWLTLWLTRLGAEVVGYALAPNTRPAMFELLDVGAHCHRHVLGDIRDLDTLCAVVTEAAPEFVFHLAAQALVRQSYQEPVYTLETNVIGTAHVLEAVRRAGRPCAVLVVTSDKCYENREWVYGYREEDGLGGHDVYSASKAAAELVTASYRRSFFAPERMARHGVAVATARAGNVIGGGDWAPDRIVADSVAALTEGRAIPVRNPAATRPWQHVLEPLSGYLELAVRLGADREPRERARFCGPWNFGPHADSVCTVRELVETLIGAWGKGTWEDRSEADSPHEAGLLQLTIDQAVARLGWRPRWGLAEAVRETARWYRALGHGCSGAELLALTHAQIDAYQAARTA
jgi:CDP-glucose 4,6-dehydratase